MLGAFLKRKGMDCGGTLCEVRGLEWPCMSEGRNLYQVELNILTYRGRRLMPGRPVAAENQDRCRTKRSTATAE
jgi:hypothetical protein